MKFYQISGLDQESAIPRTILFNEAVPVFIRPLGDNALVELSETNKLLIMGATPWEVQREFKRVAESTESLVHLFPNGVHK